MDVSQAVIDVGLAGTYKTQAEAAATQAAADKLTIQGLVTDVDAMRDQVADALAICQGVVALANSTAASLAAVNTAQAAINTGMANIVTARDAAVAASNAAQTSAATAATQAALAASAALENIREMVDHTVATFPISQTIIRVDLPQNRYSVAEPIVVCTVNDAPTNVKIVCSHEFITGVGEVYTYVTFTFPPSAVGKKCNAWISG